MPGRVSSEALRDVSPMTHRRFLEGSNTPPRQGVGLQLRGIGGWRQPLIGFDIETYSPKGFPGEGQDPVVAATLALALERDVRCGLMLISLIYPPHLEERLLMSLQSLLSSIGDGCLVTYNGRRFDLGYLAHRGGIYGMDFEGVFSNYGHLDLYEALRLLGIRMPGYGQKTVERCMGIMRVVDDVSGASYHEAFQGFMRSGSLKPLFYNIEDAVGCLLILMELMRSMGNQF
ncbi:ribonuclease H-like domain-containing protein [Candidatus Bathyarchaeota archaeon]|nr:ribonuclease H-like domain-containing protein [Candidatus Bathyarchaeota archaeon]